MDRLQKLLQRQDLPDNIRQWAEKNDLLKMQDLEWFSPGDKSVCDARIADLVWELNQTRPSDKEKCDAIISQIIKHNGNLTVITPFWAEFGYIEAGKNCFIGYNCTFIDGGRIKLGNSVQIAPNVVLATATHPIDAEMRATKLTKCAPIVIEDNVWIGANSTIVGGVTIGKNSIIGAGSVVTHDIPENVVAVGSPCRVIKQLNLDKDLKQIKDYIEK